jgi:hypothetical protein
MRIRSASDVAFTTIAWLPVLVLIVAVAWVLALGVFGLESVSFGSEFLISNDATSNLPQQLPSEADALQAALDSGDVNQMENALSTYESNAAARAAG